MPGNLNPSDDFAAASTFFAPFCQGNMLADI
jgi:hypothetical protein